MGNFVLILILVLYWCLGANINGIIEYLSKRLSSNNKMPKCWLSGCKQHNYLIQINNNRYQQKYVVKCIAQIKFVPGNT